MNEMGLFETIHSSRALRRFRPEPVPDDVLARILDAAICAPSAGNGQNWLFMIIKSQEQRQKIGEIYRRAGAMIADFYLRVGRPAHMDQKQYEMLASSGFYLHDHLAEAPILLLACLRSETPLETLMQLPRETQLAMMSSFPWMAGASIYPAVQNIILACRALGLGTCLTTNHMLLEDEVKQVTGLPVDYRTFALLPIGYPVNKFGPVNRRPLCEVVALDRFGEAPEWARSV